MNITVNEGKGKNIHLRLPNGLVLNGLTAVFLSAGLRNYNVDISGKQLHTLFRAMKTYKTTHPEWKLIEVYSHDGEAIEVVF